MDSADISLPLDNSFIHTGHGSIGGDTWGSPAVIDPVYLNNPMQPPDLLSMQPPNNSRKSLKVVHSLKSNRQFSYKKLVAENVKRSNTIDRKTNRHAPDRPPPPSVGQLIDIPSPKHNLLDQPIQQPAKIGEVCIMDLPNDFEGVDETGWDCGYPSTIPQDTRPKSPDPFDTSKIFQPDWNSDKPFEPPDWPIDNNAVAVSTSLFDANLPQTQAFSQPLFPPSSSQSYQEEPSLPPNLPVKQRKADYELLANREQGAFVSELQSALSKRNDIPKIDPPVGKHLSVRNQWESKDTNIHSQKSHLSWYGNLDPYAPEANSDDSNQKNLELINKISSSNLNNSSETKRSLYSRTPGVSFPQQSDANYSPQVKPQNDNTRMVPEKSNYDKYAVFNEYRNIDGTVTTKVPTSNGVNYNNAQDDGDRYSAQRNSVYSSTSTTVYNNVECGAYGSSSNYTKTSEELSEQLNQMLLSSQGISKDTVKRHNQMVAETKRKARNLYDPVEANYQRINYGSTNFGNDDAVSDLMRAVEGADEDECKSALKANAWDLQRSLKYIKLQKLLKLGIATSNECQSELEKCNWDIVLAASRLLDSQTS